MKRRLLTIAICLLLGAVANVALAWGCAVWIPASGPYIGERRSASLRELEADGTWLGHAVRRNEARRIKVVHNRR